jgi:outer membrane lipoprotein LolB
VQLLARRPVWILGLVSLLGACATAPVTGPGQIAVRADPEKILSYEFTGRISVKQDDKGHYGNIRWVKHGPETDITLLSPLGQVAAQIHSQAGSVTLRLDSERIYQAEDGETLTRQVLGYAVPVGGLAFWLLGSPAPGSAAEASRGSDDVLESLKQQGWRIQYPEYMTADGIRLPRRLVLERTGLEIRLVVDQWVLAFQSP